MEQNNQTISQVHSETENQPVAPVNITTVVPPKKEMTWLWVVLVLVILVGAAFGAMTFLQNKEIEKMEKMLRMERILHEYDNSKAARNYDVDVCNDYTLKPAVDPLIADVDSAYTTITIDEQLQQMWDAYKKGSGECIGSVGEYCYHVYNDQPFDTADPYSGFLMRNAQSESDDTSGGITALGDKFVSVEQMNQLAMRYFDMPITRPEEMLSYSEELGGFTDAFGFGVRGRWFNELVGAKQSSDGNTVGLIANTDDPLGQSEWANCERPIDNNSHCTCGNSTLYVFLTKIEDSDNLSGDGSGYRYIFSSVVSQITEPKQLQAL